jgi:hypothetical protein
MVNKYYEAGVFERVSRGLPSEADILRFKKKHIRIVISCSFVVARGLMTFYTPPLQPLRRNFSVPDALDGENFRDKFSALLRRFLSAGEYY